jgi:hypothetical protein
MQTSKDQRCRAYESSEMTPKEAVAMSIGGTERRNAVLLSTVSWIFVRYFLGVPISRIPSIFAFQSSQPSIACGAHTDNFIKAWDCFPINTFQPSIHEGTLEMVLKSSLAGYSCR